MVSHRGAPATGQLLVEHPTIAKPGQPVDAGQSFQGLIGALQRHGFLLDDRLPAHHLIVQGKAQLFGLRQQLLLTVPRANHLDQQGQELAP